MLIKWNALSRTRCCMTVMLTGKTTYSSDHEGFGIKLNPVAVEADRVRTLEDSTFSAEEGSRRLVGPLCTWRARAPNPRHCRDSVMYRWAGETHSRIRSLASPPDKDIMTLITHRAPLTVFLSPFHINKFLDEVILLFDRGMHQKRLKQFHETLH